LGLYSSDYSPQHEEATSPLFPIIDEQQHIDFLATSRPHGHDVTQPNIPALPTKSKLFLAHNPGDVPSSTSAKSISSPSSDSAQLPVEEFLKRIARRNPLRKYGRQRGRIVEPSSSDDGLSPAPRRLKRRRTASSVAPGRKEPSRLRKDDTKTNARSLAERLYQNIVMSHGNPADCLINPDILDGSVPSSRSPLQFIPETPGRTNSKHRTWALVDPRKAVPFRSASFLSQKSLRDPEALISFKPLASWRDAAPRDALGSSRERQKPVALATDKHPTKPLSRHPLSFMPFQDAEEAYLLRLRSNRFHYARFYKTSLLTHFVLLRLPSANMQLASPTEDITRAPLPFVTASAAKIAQDALMHYSSPSAIRSLGSSSPLLPTCKMTPQDSEQLIHHTEPLDPPESNNDDTFVVLSPSSPPPSYDQGKPLKPLASFFEGFLERGRHAEQIQISTRSRFASQLNSTSYTCRSLSGSSSNAQVKYDLFDSLL
jgi:hypothetical protein